MKEGQAAKTAQTVAFARAIETDRADAERLFTDPHATRFLDTDGLWVLKLLRRPKLRSAVLGWIDMIGPGLLPYAVARTAFIDEALEAALARGVRQVLILGAGYDTRALRTPGIESAVVYEVDHPDTQAVKRERLGEAMRAVEDRVRLVAVDFDRDDLQECLASAGFRFDQVSFVIWEGVTQYLTEEGVSATLAVLADAAPGTEVIFTYAHRGLLDGTRSFPGGRRLLAAVRLLGEPFRFGLSPDGVGDFLQSRGFELLEDVGSDEFSTRFFAPHERTDRATETERVARARVVG